MKDDRPISLNAVVDELEERIRANGYANGALVSELNRCIGYIMQLPSAQQWIPMSERLPEIHQRVILSLTDGTVLTGYQGEPDCIWQVTEKDGSKLWVYDPDSYTDDIDSLPTAKDCWFNTDDPDGMSYTSITSLTYRKRFPGVAAWMSLPEPWEGDHHD